MNPREKAKELIIDMYNVEVDNISQFGMEWEMAKQCALICVDEVLSTFEQPKDFGMNTCSKKIRYWYQVKYELENYENN